MLWTRAGARNSAAPPTIGSNADAGQATAVTVVWKEGVEDEAASPGRYSRALIQNSDLPRNPSQGDAISANGTIYDVVRVDAMPYQMTSVVLQDREPEAD